jgi:small subunit ribosomal protein S18
MSISEPKTVRRRIAFRKANRMMPRRRHDIPLDKVDYKNPDLLTKFTSETGKILPRRVTGVSAKLHRKITREIKRARAVNLLP